MLSVIKRIDLASLRLLVRLSASNIPFIIPTYKATKACLKTATQHFGRKHYQNGPANAFRHAYWNYLIAKYCTKWSKNDLKILEWTENITDWHENTFRNRPLARTMDFHNNAVGRKVFEENKETTINGACELLLQMTKASVKINSEEEIKNNSTILVHITDDL